MFETKMAETKLSFYKLSFHVINSKNLPGNSMPQLLLDFKHCPVNLNENVLVDIFKNVVSTVPFSVTTDAVPYF